MQQMLPFDRASELGPLMEFLREIRRIPSLLSGNKREKK